MVRETKTLGEGRSADTEPEQLPTVRNVAVYDSTRMLNDWELAFIVEKISESGNHMMFFHKMQHILGQDFVRSIDNRYEKFGKSTSYFEIIVSWKKQQPGGLAEVGMMAKLLREIHFVDISEVLEP